MIREFLEQLNFLNEDILYEMSNVRGNNCKVENIDFSFYFSSKQSKHDLRVKIKWNRTRMTGSPDGEIIIPRNYMYKQFPYFKEKIDSSRIIQAQAFCQKYIPLFSAVWEDKLDANDVTHFFEGTLDFKSLLNTFEDISEVDKDIIRKSENIFDLYDRVKAYNIYNLHEKK